MSALNLEIRAGYETFLRAIAGGLLPHERETGEGLRWPTGRSGGGHRPCWKG